MNAHRVPAATVVLAAVLAEALRLPFTGAPLTTDEGGYGMVARLWSRGATLYDETWVDRPQGLLLVFRAIQHVDGGSATAIREVAAVLAAGVAVLTAVITARLVGRVAAAGAGLLVATAGASPFIESFTLSGELLASVFACASMLAFVVHLRTDRMRWLVAAGLLSGCAVMMKQSGFDAGAAAVLFLLISRRRDGIVPAAALVGAALVPVAVGAIASASLADWWYAMVTYRTHGDSILTGSPMDRISEAWHSVSAASKALGLMVVVALPGLRRVPLLAWLWLGCATLAVVGGGNFHAHYYQQLVPPLGVLGGIGVAVMWERRARAWAVVSTAVAGVALAFTIPLWFASPDEQARVVFPHDRHLRADAEIAEYVRAHTTPDERILGFWAAANLYYLADREPAVRHLWSQNIRTIPGALDEVRKVLAGPHPPALVILEDPPADMDRTGETARILEQRYRQVAVVERVAIHAPR
jgi:4-amino-4-deoxy-L-arabinose transferase-like glycosyltransferase